MYGQIKLSLEENRLYSIDDILQVLSEEQIISHYLGINDVSRGSCYSPFREERRPSCTIRYVGGRIKFHDFFDDFKGDVFDVLNRLNNQSLVETLQMIARDMISSKQGGMPKRTPRQPHTVKNHSPAEFKPEIRTYTIQDMNYWLSYKIESKTLDKFNVYPVKRLYYRRGGETGSFSRLYYDKVSDPCYVYVMHENGKEKYKFYFPFRRDGRTRFLSNTSTSIIQGMEQLPGEGDELVITKSMKDIMAYDTFEVPAIAPNAESIHLTPDIIDALKRRFLNVLSNYDYDKAGKIGAMKLRRDYKIRPVMFGDDYPEKDFADFTRNHTVDEIRNLIENVR